MMEKTKNTKKLAEKVQSPKTLGQWILDKCNTENWRAGKLSGEKHFKAEDIYKIRELIGLSGLIRQTEELEANQIVRVDWGIAHREVKKIDFPVKNMELLFQYEGIPNPCGAIRLAQKTVRNYQKELWSNHQSEIFDHEASAKSVYIDRHQSTEAGNEPGKQYRVWLTEYYESLLYQLDRGQLPSNASDEGILKCFNAIAVLLDQNKSEWKRFFSSRVLGDSKLFENSLQDRILTQLEKSPLIPEDMSKKDHASEILAEHGIMEYSQTLELKGAVMLVLDDPEHTQIDLSVWKYGAVLNAQTLFHATPVRYGGEEHETAGANSTIAMKKIVCIENKANYEAMKYDPQILYIYTHGFLSPVERGFLRKLGELSDENTQFLHWSDMDFGGIRIFNFMKEKVFPNIHPRNMNRKTYEQAIAEHAGIELSDEKRKKLKQIDAGELEDLKQCILEHGLEIEQEWIAANLL